MFLLIFADGRSSQLHSNLSVMDLLAVRQGLLSVYRWKANSFQRLVAEQGGGGRPPFSWVEVSESSFLSSPDGRIHSPAGVCRGSASPND